MKFSFFVQGTPRPGGSKTAMPIYGKSGHAVTKQTATGKHRPVLRYVDDGKGNKEWRKLVAYVAAAEMAAQLPHIPPGCALSVHFMFYVRRPKGHYSMKKQDVGGFKLKPSAPALPTSKPDVLKLARSTEDALTSIVWKDDASNVTMRLDKRYADNMPEGCAICVETMDSDLL